MIVQGPVDEALERDVETALATAHTPLRTILLASFGGDEERAHLISEQLTSLHVHRMIVPPGFACESACLLIAIAAPQGFEPADTATLMFHREWRLVGPRRCLVCVVPNWLRNVASDWRHGPRSHRAMQGWANILAPGLGQTLAACKSNPFDSLRASR